MITECKETNHPFDSYKCLEAEGDRWTDGVVG